MQELSSTVKSLVLRGTRWWLLEKFVKALVFGLDGSATSKMGSDLATLTGVFKAFKGKLSSYREASLSQFYNYQSFDLGRSQKASRKSLHYFCRT